MRKKSLKKKMTANCGNCEYYAKGRRQCRQPNSRHFARLDRDETDLCEEHDFEE